MTFSRSNDINAFVSGDIQFDQTSPDKVIHSALGGFPVKMVMATTRGLNLALVVHPSIKSARRSKGQVRRDHQLLGSAVYRFAVVLERAGPDKGAGRSPQYRREGGSFEAVNNKVAAAIWIPLYHHGGQRGFKLIVDLTPLDVPYLRNIVAVSENLCVRSPHDLEVRRGLSGRHVFYRNNANKEENIRILAKYLRVPLDKNRAMVEEGYETYRDMLLKKPYADPSAMKFSWTSSPNPIPKPKI